MSSGGSLLHLSVGDTLGRSVPSWILDQLGAKHYYYSSFIDLPLTLTQYTR